MSSMTLPFNTSAIAPELWARIVALLEPPAILSLSKTCKHLHGLSTDRNIWAREIRTMCLERGLFSPSYPVDDMDIAHLQRAAMGPYLCEDLFQTHSVSLNDSVEPKSLEPASEFAYDIEVSTTRSSHLVLGGRFFITAGDRLTVWDLGVPGHAPLTSPVVISSLALDFPGEVKDLNNISVSVVGDRSLRIAVMLLSYATVVYEICLDDEKPALRLLPGMISPGHLQHHQYGWSADLNGNLALLSTIDNTLVIWDYIAKRYKLWTIDMAMGDWGIYYIMFFGDLLVAISPQSLKIWLVPTPDRPCDAPTTQTAFGPNDLTPCPPDLTIDLPAVDSVADVRGAVNFPLAWHPRSGDPLTFDVLYTTLQDRVMLGTSIRYQLAVTFHDDASPAPISADLQLIDTFDFMGRYQYRSYNHTFPRYISGFSVPITVCKHGTMVYGVYSVTPAPLESYDYPVGHPHTNQEDPASAIVRLTRLHSVGDPNSNGVWSLCASSGRLVYLEYQSNPRASDTLFVRSYLY